MSEHIHTEKTAYAQATLKRRRPRRISPAVYRHMNTRKEESSIRPEIYPLPLPAASSHLYSKSELATAAEMYMKLQRGDDLRRDLIEQLRTSIENEAYENALKVEIAVDRILAELEGA